MDKLSGIIKKYPKALLVCCLVALGLFLVLYGERCRVLRHATQENIPDERREEGPLEDDFYRSRLTEGEEAVLDVLEERMASLQGGLTRLPVSLDGREYCRVMTALEAETGGGFYGFYEIPMTRDLLVLQEEKGDITEVTEPEICYVILFLSCAEGIERRGHYGEDGRLLNSEEVSRGLGRNLDMEVEEIRKRQGRVEEEIRRILGKVEGIRDKKETMDVFLQWMDSNLSFWDKSEVEQARTMKDVIDKGIEASGIGCILKGQASVAGYNHLLSRLCREAGIPSHVVAGTWGGLGREAYMLCAVEVDGEWIYIDAAGRKSQSLGGQRYLRQEEALRHLSPAEYFTYEEERP